MSGGSSSDDSGSGSVLAQLGGSNQSAVLASLMNLLGGAS